MASYSPLLSSPAERRAAPRLRDRATAAIVLLAGVASAGLLWWAFGNPLLAGLFLAAFVTAAAIAWVVTRAGSGETSAIVTIDWSLLHGALEDADAAVAVTDRTGRMVYANSRYDGWFEDLPTPPNLALATDESERLAQAGRVAWRDGVARAAPFSTRRGAMEASIRRAGSSGDHLVWRFTRAAARDMLAEARRLIEGEAGRRLGGAGVMACLVDRHGRLIAGNRAFLDRALGSADARPAGRAFTSLLRTGADDFIRLEAEPEDADPIRLIQIPLDENAPESVTMFFLLDEDGSFMLRRGAENTSTVHVHALLAMLPLGLALAERDGRFLFMNKAFERAAGIIGDGSVIYPSDLVVEEDKGAVSDAVRRFASGRAVSGDLPVRLRNLPEEPISLTIAGAKGLGDAAVLLSLKDNSEESRLKRQIAQATKMQAVGQLAGGVAHDFNNILTAIIGHCDLMIMRHTPGDSDYDDVQQIKHNSNRAASLTRQLLAFSRQQTLRPQVLQLPDVISEISNLLKRLLGETVTLDVKHGRNLGAVRADPGQLEQVIVNLAVNARDAMPEGGKLTLQTYSVSQAEVRRLQSDILPIADYTALSVSDTGTGIQPELIGKIFEPFFTTKEVGKGTGLGLSTVYGIVKQTGGFIFADSKIGEGTSFVIYLPVHRADRDPAPAPPPPKEKPGEIWGTGTILLVEDEAMVRAVAERALTRQGYKVVTATNGEEALELLETMDGDGETIDLLISDVVMPTMDGPTLVRHARDRFPELPILFMSGYAEEQLRRSIDLDRVAFLPKPFSVQQLGAAARDAMIKKP